MVIGYARVSTDKQDTDNQKHELLEYAQAHALLIDRLEMETISSRVPLERRLLSTLLGELKPGDVLLTTEYSRLGRTSGELLGILERLRKQRIVVHVTKQNRVLGDSMADKVLDVVFALMGEIERDFASQRTREAIAAHRATGQRWGRPRGSTGFSKLDEHLPVIKRMLRKGLSRSDIARWCDCAESTLKNFIRTRGLVEELEEGKKARSRAKA